MGAGRALPDLAARGRRSAHAPATRGVRRVALLGSLRRALARAAERHAAVARGLRPGPALAAGGLLRDADARPARGAAAGGGAQGGAVRRRPGQPHPAQHTRERRARPAGGGPSAPRRAARPPPWPPPPPPPARPRFGGGKAARGEAGLRPAAPPVGGRAVLRLDGPLPPAGPRPRAPARDAGGLPLRRLHRPHAPARRRLGPGP